MNPTQTSTIRIAIVALIVLLAGSLVWALSAVGKLAQANSTGVLTLTVVPHDAKLLVDNKTYATSDTLNLVPGPHTIAISRDGFAPQTISINMKLDEKVSETVLLQASGPVGLQYLQDNPNQQQEGEAVTGAQANTEGQKMTNDNPLIKLLPYIGSDFEVDAGVSKAHPNDPTAVAIYVTSSDASGPQNALKWIRAMGYNPSGYEIIYESGTNGQ